MSGDGPKIISLVDKLELPPKQPSIAEYLRQIAEDLDSGKLGEVREVAIIIEGAGGIIITQHGPRADLNSMHMLCGTAMSMLQDIRFPFPTFEGE